MHMTRGWTGLRTAVIALGIIAGTTTGGKADMLTYSSIGTIDPFTGVTGTPVIGFKSLTDVSIASSSNVPVGAFQLTALPSDQTTTYDDTPFRISFVPHTYDGIAINDANVPLITGTLTGTVTPNASNVVATINSITNATLPLPGATSTITVPGTQLLLVPAVVGSDGITTVEAAITTNTGINEIPAPEPSTIAIFLSAVGGIGLRRFVLSRRQRKQA